MTDKNYTWNADDYAKHSTAQLGWARELISKLELKGDEKVLDIGCGDGKITAEIAKQLPSGSILGIDNSANMISLAKSSHDEMHPNLLFSIMDAKNLLFKNEFDIVFSNAALHWLKDHQAVLTGISNSLVSGGRFLLQMGGKGNAAELISIVEKIIAGKRWSTYFNNFSFPYGFYSPDEYQKWAANTDLILDRIELFPKDMVYDSKEKLYGWFRTTWLPYIEQVPKNLQKTFLNEILKAYLKSHPPDNTGNILVKMVRLEAQGRKKI